MQFLANHPVAPLVLGGARAREAHSLAHQVPREALHRLTGLRHGERPRAVALIRDPQAAGAATPTVRALRECFSGKFPKSALGSDAMLHPNRACGVE